MSKFRAATFMLLAFILVLPFTNYASDNPAMELKLYMGQIKTIPVSNPTRVAIGNPAIADVSSATRNEVTLNPKGVGKTTLVVWDNFGQQDYQLMVLSEDLNDVKERIDSLLRRINMPGVSTQIEEEEGKILLMGRLKTTAEKDKMNLALGSLKAKTVDLIEIKEEETAVEIDVQVLELDKGSTTTLGFTNPLSNTITFTEVGTAALTAAPLGSMFRVHNFSRSAFSWTLDALVQEGKARVLSRPRLACQSGKEAELLVGGEQPIFTTNVASAGGSGTTVDYKEYGIKLKIKPTVTEDNRVKVSLNVEISELQTALYIGATNNQTALANPLTKRNITTEVYLNSGQTLSIGGLMKQKQDEAVIRTPWLSKIPVVGWFFKKVTTNTGGSNVKKDDMELFITLTPTIILNKPLPQTKIVVNTDTSSKVEPQAVMPSNQGPEDIRSYANVIQQRILENVSYPASAKTAGFQGTVKLGLHLSFTGQLSDIVVKNSSGYNILDEDALNTAKRIASYPPFPPSVTEKDIWVDVPISYKLD